MLSTQLTPSIILHENRQDIVRLTVHDTVVSAQLPVYQFAISSFSSLLIPLPDQDHRHAYFSLGLTKLLNRSLCHAFSCPISLWDEFQSKKFVGNEDHTFSVWCPVYYVSYSLNLSVLIITCTFSPSISVFSFPCDCQF